MTIDKVLDDLEQLNQEKIANDLEINIENDKK